jgi:SAM-dependent methyltransferase
MEPMMTIQAFARGVISRARPAKAGQTYQEKSVEHAGWVCALRGAKVLVVGANKGEDCRLFVDRGAAEVHGLDVIEDVGSSYSNQTVRYHRGSIEGCDLSSNYFDLVFSMATMEHVPNIAHGFAEMVRLAKPGGKIISHAAPLWQSPYGHHMSCFDGHPWAHLVFPRDELVLYAKRNGIDGERGIKIEYIINYMLDPTLFNMRPGTEYLAACAALQGIKVHRNRLNKVTRNLLRNPLGQLALKQGFTPENLLGEHHHFFATKIT